MRMRTTTTGRRLLSFFLTTGLLAAGSSVAARAQDASAVPAHCAGKMRPLSVGVSVVPPRVVHTVPYVAKGLGLYAKYCIDATILAFEGASSATHMTAVQQGRIVGSVTHVAIGRGMKGKQIWGMAPRLPQYYVVSGRVQKPADLKGKRLSAMGGGVGSFNWTMGREVLRRYGMTEHDVQWIPGSLTSSLPSIVNGQLDGFAGHAETLYLARQQNPDVHPLLTLGEVMPDYMYNAYGAAEAIITKDRALLVDFVAAMIEANRAIFREKDKVLPIMVKETQMPAAAVEFAWAFQLEDCSWSVNTGFDKARTEWSIQNSIDSGDLEAGKRPTYEQIVDESIANEALAKVGGPIQIGNCKM